MAIVIKDDRNDLIARFNNSGVVVTTESYALKQDFRPARIGLLNLMPAAAMQSTENQWMRYISNTVLQVEPVFVKFDDDIRERPGSSREGYLKNYIPFSEVASEGLDALIVTGDNLELKKDTSSIEALEFDEINYGEDFKKVIDWARENVFSTIYSCLASHFALNYLHGMNRVVPGSKIFGVYEHQVDKNSKHPLLRSIDDHIRAPHSRWGTIDNSEFKDSDVEILCSSEEVGWLLASDSNNLGGYDLYLQGHPEYDKYDLHAEFLRDWQQGQKMPKGYYAGDNPASLPELTWANDARALHSNWIAMIYKYFSGI